MTVDDFVKVVSCIGGVLSPIVIVMLTRQNKKLEEVHKSTNGLAARNEEIARKLGIAEGTATGLEEGRSEH
jgi:hypothetical protein